jgi:hypothetical protein
MNLIESVSSECTLFYESVMPNQGIIPEFAGVTEEKHKVIS